MHYFKVHDVFSYGVDYNRRSVVQQPYQNMAVTVELPGEWGDPTEDRSRDYIPVDTDGSRDGHCVACVRRKEEEGNVLFNDALNTFYLRLYGVIHKVNDHSDCERGNPLPPHWLLFPISSKSSFICTIPQTG